MSDKNLNTDAVKEEEQQQYSLNDDRRVKTLSPGRLVAKRFFRNRVAVTGLVILAFMFVFSFLGGAITPYAEDQLFYRYDYQSKQYAGVTENNDLRYVEATPGSFPALAQAQFYLATTLGKDTFSAMKVDYSYVDEGNDFYAMYTDDGETMVGFASKSIVSSSTSTDKVPFDVQYGLLHCLNSGEKQFEIDGVKYDVDEDGSCSYY